MDANKDSVISPDEFSGSPEVSKLPQESRDEMFDEIDLNKDGLLQYDEFKKMAQITESHILFESEKLLFSVQIFTSAKLELEFRHGYLEPI